MAARKIAISVPSEVMKQVDRAASRRRMTRSGYITDVLRRVATSRSDAETTARINRLFSDPDIVAEQQETSELFDSVGSNEGLEW